MINSCPTIWNDMTFDLPFLKDYLTMAAALVGAVLGIMNTWNALNQRKVRLRVRPAYAIANGAVGFSIEVTNLSTFPVTITEVGATLPNGERLTISAYTLDAHNSTNSTNKICMLDKPLSKWQRSSVCGEK